MKEIEDIKGILDNLSSEIFSVLAELKDIQKDGNIKTRLDRDDLFDLINAFSTILRIEKYIGLTEVERIIEASYEPPMKLSAKKYHGFDGCFE